MSSRLMADFRKNINHITNYYKMLIKRTKQKQNIGSINEWIVDNYYIISEQEKSIIGGYRSKEIRIIKGKRKKQLYSLMYSYLKASDFKIDMPYLFEKINAYQRETNDYFSYNEINFICLAIRMILLSELYHLAKRLESKLIQKDEVDKLFVTIRKRLCEDSSFELEDYVKINEQIIERPYYIEQLNYKLKEMGHLSESTFVILNELLLKKKISLKEVIKESHNAMAKDNFLMINIFTSLKRIVKYEIEYLYKNISYTERALINEEADIYDQLYDYNKQQCRKEIIKRAHKSNETEYEYALKIVEKANQEKKHVGSYLFKQKKSKYRSILYVSTIVAVTLSLSLLIANYAGLWMIIILLIPISGLVIEIVNQLLNKFAKTSTLFKLKFEDGLPKEYSTMVVIPTIVKDKKKVNRMFENLEVYYLSNKTDNIYFTLLGDCSSEKVRDIDEDKEIIEAGLNKVNELNEKYGRKLFYFIYRNRFYSKSEDSYLGFERKRGALNHFNKLLLGKLTLEQKREYFNCQTFDDFKAPIKYVITLDTDTKLVLNTALKMIGAMAYPLNRPVLSNDGKKVVSGYGIMQPRISIDVEVTNKSLYSQLFAGLGGLDIYTKACFDLYQDVFNEGSFVGKGIYDLDVFDKVLGEAFPNNLILSHDLLEGNYLRCGFINDVELFDDYPANYLNDAMRHHRWNRGDWQIIGWLKKKVKNLKGMLVSNPINFLSKWKIFDNLRRSLVNVFLLLIIFFGFTVGVGNALYYILLVGVIIAIPILFYLLSRILNRSRYDFFLKYYLNLIRGMVAVVNKSFIVFAVLPYEAYLNVDSIVKSMYRMFISKKKLLNWITAEEMEKLLKNNLTTYIKTFKANYVSAVLLLLGAYVFKPESMLLASLIAVVWFLTPIIMYVISRSLKPRTTDLDERQKKEIKDIAIKTWKYFNDFLIEEYNYLIPDNYQFNREKKVDYKTSPSNIAFSLLSIISAAELEFISYEKAVRLITQVIKTIEKLNKWHGHLFNWYDIHTLQELRPYFISAVDNGNFIAALYTVKGFVTEHGNQEILYRVTKLMDEMDFSKLYNENLDVFSIGYNGGDQILLNYHYNNFASESRLTSFIAIAKGDAPFKHWFCLDKTLTKYRYYKGVASWSGTAFEYFMPLIFMKTYEHTLIDESYYFAYYAQREFVKELDPNLPWGISESAYHELDDSQNYKYKAFGVPYLKLQDSISYPIVISPYSSLMAIEVDDQEVYHNIKKLKKLNMYGEYGFYEAYDHEDKTIIKSYYAHHQGMILASLTNYLKEGVIRNYFHSDKTIEAIEMLLKEKVQVKTYIDLKMEKYKRYQYSKEIQENDVREYDKLKDIPEIGVLSNGFYSILINDRGVGFSKYKNLQINRYREIASDDYGLFLYIRNINTNKLWCNTYAPLDSDGVKYKTIFASDRVKYIREDEGIVTNTEITVVKDHNAEIRKITFINNSNNDVTLEVTSYGEVIMSRNEEDVAHRTFNSLTISSEADKDTSSLIFTRKSRTKENTRYFIVHRLFLENENTYPFEYETSRTNFLGRNNTVSNPDLIINQKPLSKTIGASIDPIMSIRKKFIIKAKGKETLHMLVGFGKSREQVMEIVRTYKDKFSVNKAFEMTTVFSNMRNSYSNLKASQMRLYNTMLKYIYQALPLTKERQEILKKNNLAQPDLWKFGISGDWPIILVEISKIEDAGFVKEVLQAYEFYKSRAIYIDIFIINNEDSIKEKLVLNYINDLMYRINNLNYFENSPGGVYVVSASEVSPADRVLLNTVARISLNASKFKSLEEQVYDITKQIPQLGAPIPSKMMNNLVVDPPKDIVFYNNFGGFVNGGKEYFINQNNTPTPWSNIIANNNFGFIVTNNFGGFTYAYNSREFKITSWSNDITEDPKSESIVINGMLFKPSFVKHGFGYSIFFSSTDDLDVFVKVFVGDKDNIKFYELTINNKLDSIQTLTIDFILKLVLGVSEESTHRNIVCHFDEIDNCLYAKNAYNEAFSDVNVFVSATERISHYNDLSAANKSITVNLNLKAKETKVFSFILGCSKEDNLLEKYHLSDIIKDEFNLVVSKWERSLSVINVKTPDEAFDYVINGWYQYQAYASRLLARSGFYQVGGAIGFRDQLQDSMGIMYSDPGYARKQILEHAKHQFKEGDVLHWWHEEIGMGSRTKFSDDYLWLIYVTYEYIRITGDKGILEEEANYIEGEKLTEFESEKGINYHYTPERDTLYNHMKLCVNKSLSQFGKHDLPLMGSGDWNDGMNRVGHKGRGESVFVGFFLYDLLAKMADIAENHNDKKFSELCLEKRESLKQALDNNAWDGAWYLRAYFDNGIPLGSRNNAECQIDLLCQSWGVLSGVADNVKKESLFREVENRLVDRENRIIRLLTPGFKNTRNNPGYIKDYAVGIRENGGQYTHAALWYIMALLRAGNINSGYKYYQMINPVKRTVGAPGVEQYKVEPYVIAADIYSNPDNAARGGWTWYTGSASWAYKIGVEEILGFKKAGDKLSINPHISSLWSGFEMTYRYMDTTYLIEVNNEDHVSVGRIETLLDGQLLEDNIIHLENDKQEHKIVINMKEDL